MTDYVTDARQEACRCRAALESGSPPEFWLERLQSYANQLEKALGIVQSAQLDVRIYRHEQSIK